ncbi:Site-specific DNA recombinase [Halobiforma haloterrestris]|uniref:Site-specific DNA recombinase n=1 Tax=Natronobacterium haloterrestre TaxID=148448 RepID=A0A1I1EWN4_NATHA|nr:recombinase family protein [Halobiforma haloterrestris]SFB91599.1 Site-specific DNA recombinase [Halobiforma haloterrestris]
MPTYLRVYRTMIGVYLRVSTEDQSVDRQREATTTYVTDTLERPLNETVAWTDKSTGTDTERSGYQDMIDALEDLDAVVCKSVSRISRSIRDLDRTVERFESAGTELHIIDEGLQIRPDDDDPFQRAVLQLLGVFAELEANMAQQRTKEGIAARMNNEEYHHGPAPLGFAKDDGRLVESDDYDRVTTVLEMVSKGEMSKRQAARELDTSRRTIGRALDRGELYGL